MRPGLFLLRLILLLLALNSGQVRALAADGIGKAIVHPLAGSPQSPLLQISTAPFDVVREISASGMDHFALLNGKFTSKDGTLVFDGDKIPVAPDQTFKVKVRMFARQVSPLDFTIVAPDGAVTPVHMQIEFSDWKRIIGAPTLIAPARAEKITKVPGDGLDFQWQAQEGTDTYSVEITDRNGATWVTPAKGFHFRWLPLGPGVYRWRVGRKNNGVTQWSEQREFTLAGTADGELDMDPDEAARPQYSLLGRLAQGIIAYSARDQDYETTAAGSALIGVLNAEFRWRARRAPESKWLLSGSVNFEFTRLTVTVLQKSYYLPRGYARVFYTTGQGAWRAGPLLHLSMSSGSLFIAESPTVVHGSTLSRMGIGAGGVIVYEASKRYYLSGLAMFRMDSGGSSAELPNAPSSNLGYEAGFGVVVKLSQKFFMEGRMRVLDEKVSWKPRSGVGTSFQDNTYIFADIGFGFAL